MDVFLGENSIARPDYWRVDASPAEFRRWSWQEKTATVRTEEYDVTMPTPSVPMEIYWTSQQSCCQTLLTKKCKDVNFGHYLLEPSMLLPAALLVNSRNVCSIKFGQQIGITVIACVMILQPINASCIVCHAVISYLISHCILTFIQTVIRKYNTVVRHRHSARQTDSAAWWFQTCLSLPFLRGPKV